MSVRVLIVILVVAVGCDQGLAPPPEPMPTGIAGVVRFLSVWPPADSVRELRVVAFQRFPLPDSAGIAAEILAGRAFVSDTLPRFVSSAEYRILFERAPLPDTLRYIAVAWRYGDDVFADWWIAGIYGTWSRDSVEPYKVVVQPSVVVDSVNIVVDFRNLPPQPFE